MIWYIAEGNADFGVLGDFTTAGSPALAILAGVSLSFFAMTGFENTANVAEETDRPAAILPARADRRHGRRRRRSTCSSRWRRP